ncbi:hypothetical protein G1C97_1882 [Bifidobacterium sp. DSM 109959]|uniref:Uncharacterized protein n=1 Tax=Bifidobacterium olomucense TaxID=2675324 RepID=A0A7Y0EYV7_9BIFI|nr:hypothetical protein [Bifidobacterium sp. DSM 109959]
MEDCSDSEMRNGTGPYPFSRICSTDSDSVVHIREKGKRVEQNR